MKNIILLLLLVPASLGAFDTGLLLLQNAGLDGDKSGIDLSNGADYTATLIPRFSFFPGKSNSWDVFISAGVTANYDNDEWSFFPELLRTEISGQIGSFRMKAGRIPYADPLNFVVNGLFDGAQFFVDTTAGTFNAGAWYTGFLYKKKAYITMTPEDYISYYFIPLDYNYFADTYFASRRVLAALSWEHPSLAEIIRFKFALVGQFDLNARYNPYHSQYASLKAGILVKQFVFELGGVFQTAETIRAAEEERFNIGYAGELGVSWALPMAIQSQLSLNGQYSSGRAESGIVAAFVPITAKEQGILKARFSGISIIDLDYSIHFHQTLSAGLTASYFIRNDLGTYRGYPLNDSGNSDGHFLGGELLGRLIWSPISDLRFNLGGGIFFPSLGDAAPDADYRWRVELGLILSIY